MNYPVAVTQMLKGMDEYVRPQKCDHGLNLAHAVWMLNEIELHPDWSESKKGRWLGWAQAIFAVFFIYTLEEMKEINRRSACDDQSCLFYGTPHNCGGKGG